MQYSYTAYNKNGQIVKGALSAESKESVKKLLKARELIIVDIDSKKESLKLGLAIFGKVGAKDKIIFTKELAIMIKAGLSIVESLNSIAEEIEKKKFKKAILAIAQDIKGGESLSKSIARHPEIFPPIYSSVIESGEASGKLDQVLLNLAEQMQKDADLMSKVKGALTYPAMIMSTMLLVGVIILITVIPQLEKVFKDVGVALPLPTRILLWLSHILASYWWLIGIAFVALLIFTTRFIKTNAGRHLFDGLKMKIPLFKNLFIKIYSARFARTAFTLISSGVPINEIFGTVGQVINNVWYAQAMDEVCEKIKAGKPLSSSLEETKKFPHLISSLIKVGEQSGNIAYVLGTVAEYFEKEVDADTNRLSALIEPIVMLTLGVGVGFIVLSVLMPVYQLVNVL